jgi:DHA2 family methylenomycin A resistance protein-like MFS transporter
MRLPHAATQRRADRPSGSRTSRSAVAPTAAPALAIAALLIDAGATAAALPAVRAGFAASLEAAAWIAIAAPIGFAAFLLVALSLARRIGARRVIVVGAGFFALTVLASAAAPSIGALIAARSIQGLAAAAVAGASLVALADPAPEPHRPSAALAALLAAAAAAGAVLGGAAADLVGWRASFLPGLAAALAATVFAARSREPAREPGDAERAPIDWAGGGVIAIGLTAAAGGFIALGDGDVGRELSFVGFVVAAIAAWVFLRLQAHATGLATAARIWSAQAWSKAALAAGLLYGSASAMVFLLPLALAEIRGWSATSIGAALAAVPLAAALVSAPARRLPARRSAPLGATAVAAALLGLALTPVGSTAVLVAPIGLAVVGAGLGLAAAPLWSVRRRSAAPAVLAAAAGAGVLGAAAAAAITAGGLAAGSPTALRVTLGVAAAAALGGVLLRRPRAPAVSREERTPA